MRLEYTPNQDNFRNIRSLTISAPFHENLEERCTLLVWSVGKERPRDWYVDEDKLRTREEIGERLAPIFRTLDVNQLRSFQ